MYKEICIQVAGLITRLGGDVVSLYERPKEVEGVDNDISFSLFIKAYIVSLVRDFTDN